MKLKDAKYFGIKLSPHRIKNDKGQLIVTGCEFARTGEQKYHSSELTPEGEEDKLNKFIFLKRPVEEVSDPKTVASFEGAPVTEDHPEDDVKVGVNWDKLAKGFATNVKYIADSDTEGHLQADFIFTDADLIKKIENHEIDELSAGYNCDVDENDWTQRHIRGNHIAVVAQARAGHQARLLDKEYKSTSKKLKTLKIGDSVVKIVDSYSYELEDENGNKCTYTDYYTEGASGKKKFLITLKDESKSGVTKEELKSKLAKEFDANVDFNGISYLTIRYKKPTRTNSTTQQKNYSRLKSILDNLGVKYDENTKVANKSNSWGMQIYLDGFFDKDGIFVADSKKVKDALVGKIHLDEPSKEDHWNTDLEFELNKKYLPEGWYTKSEYESALDKMLKASRDDKETWYSISQYLPFNNLVKEPGVPYHVIATKDCGTKDCGIKDSDDEEIFAKREEIDDKFKEIFYDSCYDISGFREGNESTEGSIYVVDINPWLDEGCYNYVEDNYEEDFDEEYLDLSCEYFEKVINSRLQDEGLYDQSDKAYVSSIDVDVVDFSGEEEYPINVHIYCKGVTK